MHEYRAAPPLDRWPHVPVDLDDEIVKCILAPHSFVRGIEGQRYAIIVTPMPRIVAPAVVTSDLPRRQSCAWFPEPISPPVYLAETQGSNRRRAIALAFGMCCPGTPERAWKAQIPYIQPASAAIVDPAVDFDEVYCGPLAKMMRHDLFAPQSG